MLLSALTLVLTSVKALAVPVSRATECTMVFLSDSPVVSASRLTCFETASAPRYRSTASVLHSRKKTSIRQASILLFFSKSILLCFVCMYYNTSKSICQGRFTNVSRANYLCLFYTEQYVNTMWQIVFNHLQFVAYFRIMLYTIQL